MKILVVCQYYYPENFQITPICEALVENGHEVTVVTGLPNYPMGVIPNEYKTGKHNNEVINGVHILRCNEIGRKKGALGLALNYFSYVYSASKMVQKLEDDFDIVFVYQLSPVLMALPAIKYAEKYNKPIFLYCCDIWPESMKTYITSENNPAFKWAKRISRKIYNSVNKIACQSASFIPYLKRVHNIPDEKLVYIPAFADETYLEQNFIPSDNIVDFVFMGNLGIAQNLIAVLEAVEKIRDISNFKVHFVGDGSVLDSMKSFVEEHRIEDIVVFHGRRPVEEMLSFYKLADACLVSLQANNEIGFTLPSKVQGYMAAGKPIIGMINGSTQDVIREAKCGICVNAGDVDAFANAMKDFMANREKYKDFGNNAREYFKENFRKKTFVNKIEKELGDQVNAKRAAQNSFIQRSSK